MTATCHEKFKRDHLYIEGGLVLKPRWADPEKCLLDEILPTTDLAKPLGPSVGLNGSPYILRLML